MSRVISVLPWKCTSSVFPFLCFLNTVSEYVRYELYIAEKVCTISVPDPWHLVQIRIVHRILLFLSVTFKTPTNKIFYLSLLLITFWRYITSFFKVTKSRNQGLSYYFSLIMEGSGSMPLTNGSGWPKTYGSYGSGTLHNIISLHTKVTFSSSYA